MGTMYMKQDVYKLIKPVVTLAYINMWWNYETNYDRKFGVMFS